jgi:hypothetical protein
VVRAARFAEAEKLSNPEVEVAGKRPLELAVKKADREAANTRDRVPAEARDLVLDQAQAGVPAARAALVLVEAGRNPAADLKAAQAELPVNRPGADSEEGPAARKGLELAQDS